MNTHTRTIIQFAVLTLIIHFIVEFFGETVSFFAAFNTKDLHNFKVDKVQYEKEIEELREQLSSANNRINMLEIELNNIDTKIEKAIGMLETKIVTGQLRIDNDKIDDLYIDDEWLIHKETQNGDNRYD
eukprot:TRINITY_DN4258_c0_g2_i1.p1 TRINITY_DN4258_c0_g2~~TRINITY_DN4258_c0_g2_i1.p1  ORF type:complete len:129 (-),score=25.75 TRINITY_DN4258_c0_g2_i1:214-600(-)